MRGIIGPNGAGKTHLLQDADLRDAADLRQDRVRGPRHHRHERHRRVPARADQELPGQPALQPADGAREPDDRGARPSCAASSGSTCSAASTAFPGLDEQVEHTLELVNLAARAGHAGVASSPTARSGGSRSGLRSRPSPSLLLLDEPLAGMSPRERVETVAAAQVDRARPHHDHHRSRHGSLFELVERVTVLQEGRVLVEGTPEEIKSNAAGAGSLSRRSARSGRMSLLEVNGLNSLLRRFPHPVRRLAARRDATRWWRCSAATAPARARR